MNYLVVKANSNIKSVCGNAILQRGKHKVCWTDGPRFTIWGLPRVLFYTCDVKVADYDTASEKQAKLMMANTTKGTKVKEINYEAMEERAYANMLNEQKFNINLPPMTNGGTIHKVGNIMEAMYDAPQGKKLTGAQLIEMIDKCYTTCEVVFEQGGKVYTYKVQRQLKLEAGNHAVVCVPDGSLKVVRVLAVHETPQLRAGINYKWIVDRVRSELYNTQLEMEAQFDEEIEVAHRKAQERSVLDKLLQHAEAGSFLRDVLAKHVG